MSAPVKGSTPSVKTAATDAAAPAAKAKDAVKTGIAQAKSSVESMAEQPKTPSFYERTKIAIANVFNSIGHAIKYIFYRLVFCKNPPSENEVRLSDLKAKLAKADSLSGEAALKLAEDPNFVTFYGKEITIGWHLRTPNYHQNGQTAIDAMKADKDTNKGKELIPSLKRFYQSEIYVLEIVMRPKANEEKKEAAEKKAV